MTFQRCISSSRHIRTSYSYTIVRRFPAVSSRAEPQPPPQYLPPEPASLLTTARHRVVWCGRREWGSACRSPLRFPSLPQFDYRLTSTPALNKRRSPRQTRYTGRTTLRACIRRFDSQQGTGGGNSFSTMQSYQLAHGLLLRVYLPSLSSQKQRSVHSFHSANRCGSFRSVLASAGGL
ncbi:hypothetical protein ARMSODRAFT_436559 [Armillaria solidipes]|uniref:Uncharacterized protein n=1 Tax=Armillaria solidipes TaxID=1076256 RepID=A0A2H3B738_9AGAR|nr:hypothetical protein ARMSODRAFT_436559 [Armillaria solidipes]